MLNQSFVNNGYIIVRNAFSKKLFRDIQTIVIETISMHLKKKVNIKTKNYKTFCSILEKSSNNFFHLNKEIHKRLIYQKIFQRIFLSPKFFKAISNLLGKDLSFLDEPSVVFNVPENHNKKNYYFKDWHQEIWSGADTSSVIMWTPVFQKDYSGQIKIIQGSHHWGHIPHENRKPINLPDKFKVFSPKLNYTDIIIMHSMLMHKSSEIVSKKFTPRIATPCMIRNFKFKNNVFENNKSWKIFNYSEFTSIERKLGNAYLSPYRLIDLDIKDISKGSLE